MIYHPLNTYFFPPLYFTHSHFGQGYWPRSRLPGHQHGKVLHRAAERDLQVRDQHPDDLQAESHVGHDQFLAGQRQYDAAGAAQEHRVPVSQNKAKQVS